MNGKLCHAVVKGPLGEPVSCSYGYLPDTATAVIEMAGAAGLGLVPEDRRNPLYTTTYGVGQVMAKAIEGGIRHFIIGLGGSATSDCGVGMLQALGYVFRDAEGHVVGTGGLAVGDIASVDDSQVLPALKECTFDVACDVTNPLYGTLGLPPSLGLRKGRRRPTSNALTTPVVPLRLSLRLIRAKTTARLPVPERPAAWALPSWLISKGAFVRVSKSFSIPLNWPTS